MSDWGWGLPQKGKEGGELAKGGQEVNTHRLAMPAFRTAEEMALTAVQRLFSNWVISPVPLAFLPSSMTKRVRVLTSVSNKDLSAMIGSEG